MSKHIPEIGEHLYTYTPCSHYYVQAVRDPWTVASVKGDTVIIREAEPIFYGPRYFNTMADDIRDNPSGKLLKLRWNEKKQRWQESPAGSYPRVAVFGEWQYFPYLD